MQYSREGNDNSGLNDEQGDGTFGVIVGGIEPIEEASLRCSTICAGNRYG